MKPIEEIFPVVNDCGNKIDDGRFWNVEEIKANTGKDIFYTEL